MGQAAAMQSFVRCSFNYYAGLGVSLDPKQLIVTTGASEAVHLALATCLDHGDELLVPDPMYANYLGYGGILGNQISRYRRQ